jgi:oxepin-CoA hydrolase/3-oxo-5,6-dehydrosuberyl-CoA semialdehyde dehydrogenase
MQHFDSDYLEHAMTRLEAIPEDAIPAWGSMGKQDLVEHLVWAVRHSMVRSRQVPFFGNWFTCRVIGPLFLRGYLPIPRNLKLPRRLTVQGITAKEPGDIETLHALLEEYLNLVQADELKPAPHPAFGDIGLDGWDCMHVRHFEHHLRQFGV